MELELNPECELDAGVEFPLWGCQPINILQWYHGWGKESEFVRSFNNETHFSTTHL